MSKDRLKVEGLNFQGFGIIPKAVMKSREISLGAKALYAYIRSYCGGGEVAWPGRDLIMADLGVSSKTTYYKYLNELKEKDLIRVEQKIDEGGKFSKNIFTVVEVPNLDKKSPCPKKWDTETVSQKNRVPKNGTPKKWDTNNNSNNNNSIENNNNNKDTNTNKVTKYSDEADKQSKNVVVVSPALAEKLAEKAEKLGIDSSLVVSMQEKYEIELLIEKIQLVEENIEKIKNINGYFRSAVEEDWKQIQKKKVNGRPTVEKTKKDKYRELYMNWGG